VRGDVLNIYILLNLICRLLRPHPSGLSSKGYNSVIRAFIYILKRVLYSAVSCVRLYINIRVKVGQKVHVIRRYVSATIYITLPRLYKGKAILRALIQRLIIIFNYSLLLKSIRELKYIFFITHIEYKDVIGVIRAVQYIIGNDIV